MWDLWEWMTRRADRGTYSPLQRAMLFIVGAILTVGAIYILYVPEGRTVVSECCGGQGGGNDGGIGDGFFIAMLSLGAGFLVLAITNVKPQRKPEFPLLATIAVTNGIQVERLKWKGPPEGSDELLRPGSRWAQPYPWVRFELERLGEDGFNLVDLGPLQQVAGQSVVYATFLKKGTIQTFRIVDPERHQ